MKNKKQDKEFIKNQVKSLIGDFFININSDIYIPKSDIIYLLKNNIKDIDSIDLYFLSERNETAISTGSYIDNQYIYDPSKGVYNNKIKHVYIYPGENPNLGLDAHGNIFLNTDHEFPVLMGGWHFINNENQPVVAQPLTITIE